MLKIGPVNCTNIFRYSYKTERWDETCESDLVGFCISYSETTIRAVQFLYAPIEDDGYSGSTCSHPGPSFKRVWFNYPSEYLTSISGSYDDVLGDFTAITFGTNTATYGPFGCTSARENHKTFSFDWGPYNDFRGSHGMYDLSFGRLIALGVYLKRSSALQATTDERPKC